MTEGACCKKCARVKSASKRRTGIILGRVAAVLWLFGVLGFALFFSGEVAGYAIDGLTLAVFTVLPTAIPSMVLCDLYRCYGHPERLGIFGRIFRTVYGVSPHGLRA